MAAVNLQDCSFTCLLCFQIAEELMKLRKEQDEIESKLKLRVTGLPLFDTILEVCATVVFW